MAGMVNGTRVEPKIWMAVLYDPQTGRIAHSHRVLQFDPERKIDAAHVEKRAREMAMRHGWDVSQLETLHVDFNQLKKGRRYKVHPESRSLVELPLPHRPEPHSPLRRKA